MTMGTASFGCGCSHTLCDGFGTVVVVRCPKHYDPAVDDARIAEAAVNMQRWRVACARSQQETKA